MSSQHPEIVGAPSLLAEMREIVEETRKAIEVSQASLDRCDAEPEARIERAVEDIDLLAGIADGLIVAYEYAKIDQDPLTLAPIEKAMLRVGRRLARAIGPKEAGLACH